MSKILITGGTGSFGGAMVRRLLKEEEYSEIVIFSRDELKQYNMRCALSSSKLKFIIGDVRDFEALEKAMLGIDTIFHAAALKQVPTGEFFPMELVKTNILGTENVLKAAEKSLSVKKVILLSSDKAVYPINTMGMSKAVAEKLVSSRVQYKNDKIFCCVRYGNVMASRGSVIPLFIDQIKEGKELSVTDPEMTRFLLSLDDAIELVVFALKNGKNGDLFIKKAPSSTVGDLAQALLNIFDAKNKNVKIIGSRAGEKIHETLATKLELLRANDLGDYFCIKDQFNFDYDDFYTKGVAQKIEHDYTSGNTKILSVKEIEKLLLSLDYVKKEIKNY